MIDFVVDIIFEWLLEGLFGGSRAAARRNGRWIVGTVLGCAVGAGWGTHLRELPHWPRLLWVSLALGAISVVLAFVHRKDEPTQSPSSSGPHDVLAEPSAPTRWSRDRLIGFALVNLGVAAGIVAAVAPLGLL